MPVGVLAITFGNSVLGRFQLHNHAGEPLSKRIVDISSHSIAFGQNGGFPALLADLGEADGQHHLMGKCLG
jgi:hypothetical protein